MKADLGEVISSLINTDSMILCSPTYLGGLHPSLAHFLFTLNTLKPNIKHIAFFSSYGWQNNAGFKQIQDFLPMIKAEYLEPSYVEGYPRQKDLELIDEKVFEILAKFK